MNTDDYTWTPPGVGAEALKKFHTPAIGIPSHARARLHRWIVQEKESYELLDFGFMLDFQANYRQDLGLNPLARISVQKMLDYLSKLEENTFAALVDFVVSKEYPGPTHNPEPSGRTAKLADVLERSGAGWRVGNRNGRWGLLETLPSEVSVIIEGTISQAGRAGDLLASARENAFSIDKRPSYAYYDAVRAVEVYSCPLISPKDKNATLGKDINVLQNKPRAWTFALAGNESGDLAIEQLIGTLRLLWHSHTDRHGREDYENVTQAQAEAAVLLAAAVVGWLSRGLLTRVSE